MNRTGIFGLAVAAGIILAILTILTWTGAIIGHHADGPFGLPLENFKHGAVFAVLAVVAFLFAAVMRPKVRAAN
jgi:hypothetical protein